jgi:alkanesulfonate monooxygenase SsuD/methylene tetrahydromethanopterin reductase-like flavin-dependent oxidoreductase (luciferase family)
VTLAVYEVVGVTIPDDVQEFEPLNGQEPTTNIDEAETTATVFVRWDGKVTIDMYVESTEVGSYHWVLEAITEAIKLGADMTGVDDPA